jgi:hypothetical protein
MKRKTLKFRGMNPELGFRGSGVGLKRELSLLQRAIGWIALLARGFGHAHSSGTQPLDRFATAQPPSSSQHHFLGGYSSKNALFDSYSDRKSG